MVAATLSLLACVVWSGNFIVARGVYEWMHPIGFAFWRWVVAGVVLLPLVMKHYKAGLAQYRQNRMPYIIMGALGAGVFNTLIYFAAHHTSANNISLLAATSPIWTLLLAGLLGFDRLNGFKVVGVIVAFIGAFTVILKGDYEHILEMKFNIGDLIVFIASWIWALYTLMVKKKHPEMSQWFLMGLIVFFGLCVLTPLYALELAFVGHTPFTMQALYCYLYVGIGASVIAWYCFNRSVELMGPVKTSIIYYTMPIFSGVLSVLFLDEHFYKYHLVGFLLVVAGIIISNLKPKSA